MAFPNFVETIFHLVAIDGGHWEGMSFLDNLENNLKSLESQEERDPYEYDRREKERAAVRAAAPWASKLKQSAYADQLLALATRAGYKLRAKVYPAWLDSTLRLELRGRVLELRPSAEGIAAVFLENNTETRREPVDLEGNPEELLRQWLEGMGS